MILFFKPIFVSKPWAGDELNKLYNVSGNIGEAWICSGYNGRSSTILNGPYKGKTIRYLWRNHPELFGDFKEKEFPLLLKLISAGDNLSIQVHPNDDYALKKKNSLGKFECWYFLPENKAEEEILGVSATNAMELKNILSSGNIENFLIKRKVENGSLAVINQGLVHALTKGSYVLEIQESSDITYRLYDYNRLPKRELHIDDAINVCDYASAKKKLFHEFKDRRIDSFKSQFFDLIKLKIKKSLSFKSENFVIAYILDGKCKINEYDVKKSDSFIITKDTHVKLEGEATILAVIPKKKEGRGEKMRKTALITGASSQDGHYLIELLLSKDYEIHLLVPSKELLEKDYLKDVIFDDKVFVHYGDMADSSSLNRIIDIVKPDEIYHLASQSHVDMSFDMPEYTTNVNSIGTLSLLDAIRSSEISTKLFNLSSPYRYSGDIYPQNEDTKVYPKSPYAVSITYAFDMVRVYREAYSIYAVNGICYNHTSLFKAHSFVSRKIIDAVKNVRDGKDEILRLGNLNSVREYGHAKDYAYAMWLSLQEEKPDDYIISTGVGYSVRDFVKRCYQHIGINLEFVGEGLEEKGICNGKVYVEVDPKYMRATDAKVLVGDSTKFKERTKYQFEYDIDKVIDELSEN